MKRIPPFHYNDPHKVTLGSSLQKFHQLIRSNSVHLHFLLSKQLFIIIAAILFGRHSLRPFAGSSA